MARVLACLLILMACGGWTKGNGCAAVPDIIAVGDSITRAQAPLVLTSYVSLIATAFGTTPHNEGHDATGWGVNAGAGTLIQLGISEVDPLVATGACPPPILILFGGAKDIGNGATAAATFALFQTYMANRSSAHWAIMPSKVIVVPMLPQQGVNFATVTAYNTSLINAAANYNYAVARVDLDPNMGCSGCETNTTYFQVGGIHPTQVGQQILANIICLAINRSGLTCPVY